MSTATGHQDGHVRPGAHDMAARIRGIYQDWDTADLRDLLRECGRDLESRVISEQNRAHTLLRAEVLTVMIAERDAAAEGSG
jgi:hypothetical protein